MKELSKRLIGQITLFALTLWSAICFFYIAKPYENKQSFYIQAYYGPTITDFVRIYQTGAMCLSNNHDNFYDLDVQTNFTNKLIAPDHIARGVFLNYVPFMFPLMVPLAIMPMAVAYSVFYAITLSFGLGALTVLNWRLKKLSNLDFVVFLLALYSSGSSVITLRIGQTAWLLVGILCLFYYALKCKRDILCGIALSFFTLKFQYAPLFSVALFALRRWQTLLTAFITEIGLLTLAGLTIGWENVFNYPATLLKQESASTTYGPFAEHMISLRGLLFFMVDSKTALMISNIALIVAAIFIYRLWTLARKQTISEDWAMSLTVVTCLMFSPHCYAYDLVLLSIPALLTLPSLNPIKLAQLPNKPLRVWSFVMLIYPIYTWYVFASIQFWTCFVLNLTLLVSGLYSAFADVSATSQSENATSAA